MERKRNKKLCLILSITTFIYIILIKLIDVKAIGPNNSEVGFSALNNWFKDLIGTNMLFYKIAEILGLVMLLIVVCYVLLGLYQLIKRKNLLKIDRELLILGFTYLFMAIIYVFFEKVVINYRPILMDGELEASFPSSHTMLSLVVGITSLIISKKYIPEKYLKLTNIITIILMLGVLFGRTFSGVHWLSDIIGGILISATLIMCFYTVYYYKGKSKK